MKTSFSFPESGIRAVAVLFASLLTVVSADAQVVWSNTNATYPPGATQNWTTGSNWVGNVAPSTGSTATINNGGAVLVNSVAAPVSSVILGNVSGTGLTHSLYIASGGSLEVQSTGASAFRLFNTAGSHRVTVESGGTLTVAGGLFNGATGGVGSNSVLTSSGTISTGGSFVTSRNARTYITGGVLNANANSNSVHVLSSGGGAAAMVQSGGIVRGTNSGMLTLGEDGTYRISGGSLNMTSTTQGLYVNGGAGVGGRVFHVDGSGASSIDFGGLRYQAAQDQTSMVWRFTADNGANHITRVNFVNNGNAGGSVRRGTLEVGLSGGILLSGTNMLTLMEGPTISAATNFTNAAEYTAGTAELWVQSITDGVRDTLNVTLNSASLKGSMDFANPVALTFASAAYGYINLSNVNLSESFTLGLAISGGTLSAFTDALTAAGIDWAAGTDGYSVNLILDPGVSGGTAFAWDLQSIDAAMGVTGIGVIPEPSTWMLMAAGFTLFVVFRNRSRRDP